MVHQDPWPQMLRSVMYYGVVKPCHYGKLGDAPNIIGRLRSFQDIKVLGGRLNNLKRILWTKTHFGVYDEYMITARGLCHIICSRNWHNLAPHTLMYRSRLCLPACEPRVYPKVQGGRHWQHCFPFAKTEVQYYKDDTEQITLQQISPTLSILHVLSPIYKEITRNVQEWEFVVGEVPQNILLKKWSFLQ